MVVSIGPAEILGAGAPSWAADASCDALSEQQRMAATGRMARRSGAFMHKNVDSRPPDFQSG